MTLTKIGILIGSIIGGMDVVGVSKSSTGVGVLIFNKVFKAITAFEYDVM
jgi:hypothetical protein